MCPHVGCKGGRKGKEFCQGRFCAGRILVWNSSWIGVGRGWIGGDGEVWILKEKFQEGESLGQGSVSRDRMESDTAEWWRF